MTNKQALREAAIYADGEKWHYVRTSVHSKAYITNEKGSTVVNCTDGDVPAKYAGFIELASPATMLALLDELDNREKLRAAANRVVNQQDIELQELRQRVAELEQSHTKLRESMATIHNTIRMDGPQTSLAVILNAAKRAYDESATAAGIRTSWEE